MNKKNVGVFCCCVCLFVCVASILSARAHNSHACANGLLKVGVAWGVLCQTLITLVLIQGANTNRSRSLLIGMVSCNLAIVLNSAAGNLQARISSPLPALVPSIGTDICLLLLIAANALFCLFSGYAKHANVILCVCGLVAVASLVGHIIGCPSLYWDIQQFSYPMSANTSLCLLLLAVVQHTCVDAEAPRNIFSK